MGKGITDKHWTALFDMFFWTLLILGIGALVGSQNNGASMRLCLAQFGLVAFLFNIAVVTVHANPWGIFTLPNSDHGTIPDANESEHWETDAMNENRDKKPVSIWKRLFHLTFVRCVWSPIRWFWQVWPLGLFFRTLWWCKSSPVKTNETLPFNSEESTGKLISEAPVSRHRKAWVVWSMTAIYALLYIASVFLNIQFGYLFGGFWYPLLATQLVFGLAYSPFKMWLGEYVPCELKPEISTKQSLEQIPNEERPFIFRRRLSPSLSLSHQRLVKRLTLSAPFKQWAERV